MKDSFRHLPLQQQQLREVGKGKQLPLSQVLHSFSHLQTFNCDIYHPHKLTCFLNKTIFFNINQNNNNRQYYTLLEQKVIILIFISIIDINVNLIKNEIDKKINSS